MRPEGDAAALFAAFSRVNARAFAEKPRLISCPALSKSPGRVPLPHGPHAPARRFGRVPRLCARYLAANVLHFCFMLAAALFIRLQAWKSPLAAAPGNVPPLVIDTFALLPDIAASGAYRERYLPGLAETARARGRAPIILFRLYGSRDPRILWRAFQALRREPGGCVEAHLLRPADYGRLLLHLCLYPFSLAWLIRELGAFPGDSPEGRIREGLIENAGSCVLVGEARRLAGLRLAGALAGARPESPGADAPPTDASFTEPPHVDDAKSAPSGHIISWYENQTVDKCFQRGLAEAGTLLGRRPDSTGAQLFLWPPTLLNNHPDDAEAALGLAPERVLVNGPFFLPENSRQNYAVGPSLRYAALFEPLPVREPAGGPLLILLSYHPAENRRVLGGLREAGLQETLVCRFHPATRPGDYSALLPETALVSTRSFAEDLRAAGAVAGCGSGALAEAVCLGLPVVSLFDGGPESLNYLPAFGKGLLWESARTPEDVAPALEALRAARARPDIETARRAFRDLLFSRPDPESVIAAFRL